jgi:hypothetical protein
VNVSAFGISVEVADYGGFELIPLDDDLITMNMPNAFADTAGRGDPAALLQIGRALCKMQAVYGTFPLIRAKGHLSKALATYLVHQTRERERMRLAATGVPDSAADLVLPEQGGAPTPAAGMPNGRPAAGPSEAATCFGAVSSRPHGATSYAFGSGRAVHAQVTVPLLSAAGGMGQGAASGGEGDGADSAGGGPSSEFSVCILLDRGVDLVTPFMTTMTFESLIDELYDTKGFPLVKVPRAVFSAAEDKNAQPAADLPDRYQVHINSSNKAYLLVRDAHAIAVRPRLAARVTALDQAKRTLVADVDALRISGPKARAERDMLSSEMKNVYQILAWSDVVTTATAADSAFVARLHRDLNVVDEDKSDAVDVALLMAARGEPLVDVLRLLCLRCVVEGGFKAKQLEQVRKMLIMCYGYDKCVGLLRTLETTGLLFARDSAGLMGAVLTAGGPSPWSQLRRQFGLTAEKPDLIDPVDVHYVTGGYAPLSVCLVQAATLSPGGWDQGPRAEALVKLVPGPTMTARQVPVRPTQAPQVPGAAAGAGNRRGSFSGESGASQAAAGAAGALVNTQGNKSSERSTVLVCFIGGVTRAELAGLRLLSESNPIDFVVLTTCVISGKSMLSTLIGEQVK